MFQLLMVEMGLAMEVRNNADRKANPALPKMIMTSRAKGDPYKIAKKNGWTYETGTGTEAARRRALIDVVMIRVATDPSYATRVAETTRAALGDDVEVAISRGHALRAEQEQSQG